MNQFSDAIRAGLKSAEQANANAREIRDALAEISNAVLEVTDNKVKVTRTSVPADNVNPITTALALWTSVKMIDAIKLQRTSAPMESHELARLDMSANGYPCDIITGTRTYTCYDRASFVQVMEEILSSPTAGKALLSLLNIEPQKGET